MKHLPWEYFFIVISILIHLHCESEQSWLSFVEDSSGFAAENLSSERISLWLTWYAFSNNLFIPLSLQNYPVLNVKFPEYVENA